MQKNPTQHTQVLEGDICLQERAHSRLIVGFKDVFTGASCPGVIYDGRQWKEYIPGFTRRNQQIC